MRESRFRAWDKVNKKILVPLSGILWGKPVVPTDYVQGLFDFNTPDNYTSFLEGEMMWVDDCELMQFTGLKDYHDKEIYEGDIIEIRGTYYDTRRESVIFDMHAFMAGGRFLADFGKYFSLEIIGNIYENPELVPQD